MLEPLSARSEGGATLETLPDRSLKASGTNPDGETYHVVAPTGLKLPPDRQTTTPAILPESYSCTAKLGAKKLAGSGTGGCSIAVPKKKSRGKRLTVVLTVKYQDATKAVPLTFKVK